jgi:hypothetical protein
LGVDDDFAPEKGFFTGVFGEFESNHRGIETIQKEINGRYNNLV